MGLITSPSSLHGEAPAASQDVPEAELDGVPYNPPLTFELQNLERSHSFFRDRHITSEMIETFGLGIAARGMMKGRLVIPIHNPKGQLIAYCGRWPADEPPNDEPKYKQPPRFRKELELYNINRQSDPLPPVIVLVESFFSVFQLHMLGYATVSPMGRSLSSAQLQLLVDRGAKVVIVLFDGDEPGRQGAIATGADLLQHGITVRVPTVPDGFKPHRTTAEELQTYLTFLG